MRPGAPTSVLVPVIGLRTSVFDVESVFVSLFTVPACPGVAPARPGAVPACPGVVRIWPGVFPVTPGAVPDAPGEVCANATVTAADRTTVPAIAAMVEDVSRFMELPPRVKHARCSAKRVAQQTTPLREQHSVRADIRSGCARRPRGAHT
jgi:hypothetical protein